MQAEIPENTKIILDLAQTIVRFVAQAPLIMTDKPI